MTILLLISTAFILLLGYLVMWHLDNFIKRGEILDSPQGRANQGVLIYGASEVAEKIHKIGMKCKIVTEPVFPEDGFYSALFALSQDDRGNLALCYMAMKADPGITIVARCNAQNLKGVFKTMGVSKLLGAEESIDCVLSELWGAGK